MGFFDRRSLDSNSEVPAMAQWVKNMTAVVQIATAECSGLKDLTL